MKSKKIVYKLLVIFGIFIVLISLTTTNYSAESKDDRINYSAEQIVKEINSKYGGFGTTNSGSTMQNNGTTQMKEPEKLLELPQEVIEAWSKTMSEAIKNTNPTEENYKYYAAAAFGLTDAKNGDIDSTTVEVKDPPKNTSSNTSGKNITVSSDSSNKTNSNSDRNQTIDEVIEGADNFIKSADTNNTINKSSMQKTIDLIYNIFLAVGLVVAVICGLILGIQFMMSSSEGQAEVKEKLVPFIVGCVVIFGAFGIWKLVMVLLQPI